MIKEVKIEEMIEVLNNMDDYQKMTLWNELMIDMNMADDIVMDSDYVNEVFRSQDPIDIGCRWYYGGGCPAHNYFQLDGYGNIKSSDFIDDFVDFSIYSDDLIDRLDIIENYIDIDDFVIYEEEEEEVEEEEVVVECIIKFEKKIDLDIIELIKIADVNRTISSYYLTPVLNNNKSYYKKAYYSVYNKVNEEDIVVLKSYDTAVCRIEKNYEKKVLKNIEVCIDATLLSQTTKKHIEDFLFQFINEENIVDKFRTALKEQKKKNK